MFVVRQIYYYKTVIWSTVLVQHITSIYTSECKTNCVLILNCLSLNKLSEDDLALESTYCQARETALLLSWLTKAPQCHQFPPERVKQLNSTSQNLYHDLHVMETLFTIHKMNSWTSLHYSSPLTPPTQGVNYLVLAWKMNCDLQHWSNRPNCKQATVQRKAENTFTAGLSVSLATKINRRQRTVM